MFALTGEHRASTMDLRWTLFFFASRRLMLSLSSSSWTLRYQDWFVDSRCYSSLCYLKFVFRLSTVIFAKFSLGYSLLHSWFLSELLSIVIQTYSISVVLRMRKEGSRSVVVISALFKGKASMWGIQVALCVSAIIRHDFIGLLFCLGF